MCTQNTVCHYLFSDGEKVSDYEMKLMDIDSEHLGIPVSFFSKVTIRFVMGTRLFVVLIDRLRFFWFFFGFFSGNRLQLCC